MSVEKRVRRSKAHEALLSEMAEEVFTTMADALVFAASIGYEAGQSKGFDSVAEPIRYGTFEARNAANLIDLLAFAKTGDVAILADARLEDRISIFEELAEGGLGLVTARRLSESDLLDTCLSFLGEKEPESLETDILRELEGI